MRKMISREAVERLMYGAPGEVPLGNGSYLMAGNPREALLDDEKTGDLTSAQRAYGLLWLEKREITEALQRVLPYVQPIPLTPAEKLEFGPALETLQAFAGYPSGPGPLASQPREEEG